LQVQSNLIPFYIQLAELLINENSVAMDKAFTAAGHRVGTHTYKDAVWPGGAAYGLGNSNGGRFTTFGGGLPIINANGEVIGGIGASTGTPAQDQQVVQAGVDALEEVLRRGDGRVKAKL
jgi:uncharacterized protein GlcG (DUF336 family)